ncbi:hypothetical protein GXW78_23520 [Roseomonas terrae]|jgi:hypothetical protein|uniref:Uncharacterized protein n=1 Tax=Neoroseomonas terrae TaxID=424799 RepID=A0ABS5EPW5_9PROT|nr:hypothetical protein [Neoroseomonas terrae]MBR0652647.1 hypothetical protein [Neoroseomonas terrae]
MTRRFGRRAGLLALLTGLAACASTPPEQPAAPVVQDPDPEPEEVYSPGAIPWANLTEEHKRRARAALTRLGEDIPDDATLQARWMLMPPAQQRYSIRRPPPPPPRPRAAPARRGRATTPARRSPAPTRRTPTPPRRTQQR